MHLLRVDESLPKRFSLINIRYAHPLLLQWLCCAHLRPDYATMAVLDVYQEWDCISISLRKVILHIDPKVPAYELLWSTEVNVLHCCPALRPRAHVNVSCHVAHVTLYVIRGVGPFAAATLDMNVEILRTLPLESDA